MNVIESGGARRTFSGAPWEQKVGYCRAIRVGNMIAVTGTVALDETGEPYAPSDAYNQAKRCLEIIEKAIQALGAARSQILRTRMFVTDIRRWEEYGRAHGEFFAACPPATSMVEVKALIDPRLLIEIEADALAP
ncbi:MAG: RidA family protein [Bdellovibrionales bacterium]